MKFEPKPRGVLLDLDGTLIDGFGPIAWALNRTLAEFGRPRMTREEIVRHTGRGECSMISLFGDRREEAGRRFLEFHDRRLLDITPLPGAEALLRWLAEHEVPRAVVTSKSQSRAERQLAHLGWTGLLPLVIGLTPERRQKPDPHTLLLAAEALGCAPGELVMAGDGVGDMKAARRAGCYPLGVSGGFDADELRAAGAGDCVDGCPALRVWLECRLALPEAEGVE
ncbi:MAG: HAD family hydrolase [Zetaproteobacteria bacterium]|nr:MAG: HAD family hydrolase [Zetaproteobacteria bacterium]